MVIRQNKPFAPGYNPITFIEEKENSTLMDFGILKLFRDMSDKNSEDKERAYLLIQGEVTFTWGNSTRTVKRGSFLDENPWCLHVPAGEKVVITGLSEQAEICVMKTLNSSIFPSMLHTQDGCRSEQRGKGTMKETSTRIVRTVFDKSNADSSNLVLGEVIDFPGKWSSYPPHHHPQPEIYFYKFYPEQGFGYSELGEDIVKVRTNDTVKILDDVTHPQVAAPGYAMYYIWVIRHLDGNPYIEPVFVPEHAWVMHKDAKIWPDQE